nr:glycosyltransferase family 4 protein [Cerasicoccus arenae]
MILSPTQGAYGGIEAFVLELGRYLSEEKSFSVKVCLKLVKSAKIDERLEEILRSSGLPYSVVQRASPALFHEIATADLVHAQNASPDIALMTRLSGGKLVQTIHNHLLDRGRIRTASWKFGASLAHYRLYNSKFVQQSWSTCDGPDSQVIPTVSQMAIDFSPIENRRGFVFVSRLIPNKGAETLIEAYQAANIDHNAWPLHILGDGPLRDSLEVLARKSPGKIAIHGFVSERIKRERIRAARWLVAPPNTREDMGLTPLEARANGIPVISSRDGGLPESAGDQALLCEPGNIDSLSTEIERATQMSSAEYLERSHATMTSLETHLTPMSFYPKLYRTLLEA